MKKLFLFFSLLIITQLLFAQRIGLKGGANISNTTGLEHTDNKIGWYFGGVFQLRQNRKFFIQPELIYSTKGHRFKPPYGIIDGALKLNYITAPLLAGLKVNDRLSVLLGPEFGFLANSKVRYLRSVGDATGEYRRFDLAADVGLSYKINTKLGLEARYGYGLSHFYFSDFQPRTLGRKGRNQVFQIGLHYFILDK